jgi:hypothetical protein
MLPSLSERGANRFLMLAGKTVQMISVSKFGDTVLIATAILIAFLLGWIGGGNLTLSGIAGCFPPRGLSFPPRGQKFNVSPRTTYADEERIVVVPETGRPVTWEAATLVGLRLRPVGGDSGSIASSP